jgi:hypothetical protein
MKSLLLSIFLGLTLSQAIAGRPCEEFQPAPDTVMKSLELAQKSRLALDNSGANLAFIARVGQDLSKYHLRYSHMGIVFREPDGRWNVLHELNQCGSAESSLYNEGLGNFFLDNMFAYDSLILIPAPELQSKLLSTILSRQAMRLHERHYNMLAFPFSTQYQNSNQWVLEVLAAALTEDGTANRNTANRAQLQASLQQKSYRPDVLEIPALTRLGARIFRANVAFDDHPFERRMAGKIDVVTVESVDRFLQTQDSALQHLSLSFP